MFISQHEKQNLLNRIARLEGNWQNDNELRRLVDRHRANFRILLQYLNLQLVEIASSRQIVKRPSKRQEAK